MQGCHWNCLPDEGTGGDGEVNLLKPHQSQDQASRRWSRARQRTRMERPRMDRLSSGDRSGPVPIPRVRRPELDGSEVQFRFRCRSGRGSRWRHHQRARSESEAVRGSRWQADSVPRVERSADFPLQQHAVLLTRAGGAWQRIRQSMVRIGCSWRPAWGTAGAGKDQTHSTWSARSSSGSSMAERRTG